MKKYFLIILICIILMLHWHSYKTEIMIPKNHQGKNYTTEKAFS